MALVASSAISETPGMVAQVGPKIALGGIPLLWKSQLKVSARCLNKWFWKVPGFALSDSNLAQNLEILDGRLDAY